ncbi:MAG: molybdenum cofactor guanylyltransferase [Candidatus Eisenbacteria bacterium]
MGGRSRRMGTPKAGLVLPDGSRMGERMVRILSFVCREVVLVGSGENPPEPLAELPRIDDLRPGRGPLAGIEALLASGRDDAYLVVPCDQPLLLPSLLRALSAAAQGGAALFRLPGRAGPEPLPAAIPASALPFVTESLDAGRSALRDAVDGLRPRLLDVPPLMAICFRNLNEPADLEDAPFRDHFFPVR